MVSQEAPRVLQQNIINRPVAFSPLHNTLPERLEAELALGRRLGVTPFRVGDAAFEEVVNSGTVKWVVTTDGELLVIPKYVRGQEIPHTVMTEGRPILAAGEADLAGTGGQYVAIELNNHSGHYLPGPERLQIGREAFERMGITAP